MKGYKLAVRQKYNLKYRSRGIKKKKKLNLLQNEIELIKVCQYFKTNNEPISQNETRNELTNVIHYQSRQHTCPFQFSSPI